MNRRLLITLAALAAVALLAVPASAKQLSWRFTTGLDYSTGRYGELAATNVLLVPLTVKALYGGWSFRVTTNLLNIHGPANVAVVDDNGGTGSGTGGVDPTGAAIPNDNRSGLGDTTLGVDYTTSNLWGSAIYATLGGRLRLPTGNASRGLGTGATDEILNLEVGGDWNFGGAYARAGRRFLGDTPTFTRKDGWQAGFGGWWYFAKYYEVGSYYEYRNSASLALPDPKALGVYVSYRLAPSWKLQLDASKGLSRGSAASDVGLYVTYRPDGGYR